MRYDFAGRPERPERQPSGVMKEEHFMQKEHQKQFVEDLVVEDKLGVVAGVQGREDDGLV